MQQIDPEKAMLTEQRAEQQRSQSAPASTSAEPPSHGTLTRLWIAAIAVWGAKWKSLCGELPIDDNGALTVAGNLWANGLAGFDEARIMRAVERFASSGSEWPPNLPQVRKSCFGIPNLEVVRADLTSRKLGFTRLVWQGLDHWAFARADQRDANQMLREAYEVAVERRMRGMPLPPAPAGDIEHKPAKPTPATPEIARARIAEIRAELEQRVQSAPKADDGDGTPAVPLAEIEESLREHYAHVQLTPTETTGEVEAE